LLPTHTTNTRGYEPITGMYEYADPDTCINYTHNINQVTSTEQADASKLATN